MAFNLKGVSDFWVRIFGDTATPGDGSSATSPLRFDQWNSDIGNQNDTAATSDTGTFSAIALLKRLLGSKLPTSLGQKAMTGSFPVTIASDQVVSSTLPRAATATIISAQTPSAGGSNFTSFGSNTCSWMEIINNTGTVIEYRRGGAGTAFPVIDKTTRLIIGITNSNEIGIRRTDGGTTQVTIQAEVYT